MTTSLRAALAVAPLLLAACGGTLEGFTKDAGSPPPDATQPDASVVAPGATDAGLGEPDVIIVVRDSAADGARCPPSLPCKAGASCFDGCNTWTCLDGGTFAVTDIACPPNPRPDPPPDPPPTPGH